MLKILYTGAFDFPNKDAGSKRVLNNALALNSADFKVDFAGWGHGTLVKKKYLNFDYVSLDEFRSKKVHFFKRFFDFLLRGKKTLRWLEANNQYDVIIAYNPPAILSYRLLRFAKNNNIKVILDSTEWYDGSHLPGGRYGIASIENWFRMNVAYKKFGNVIAISNYLYEHYRNFGANVIKIPPLFSTIPQNDDAVYESDLFRIVYVGSPGKKDLIFDVVESIPRITKILRKKFNSNKSVVFTIVGPESSWVKKICQEKSINYSELKGNLELIGRIDAKDVEKYYIRSNYSILIREDKRYAQAGFATKFVESLSYGIPVITNSESDESDYLVCNNVGIKVKIGDFANSIASIINNFTEDTKLANIEESKKAAFKHFHSSQYSEAIGNFMEKTVA